MASHYHKPRWCYSVLLIFSKRNFLQENKTCAIRHVTVRHAGLLSASRLVQGSCICFLSVCHGRYLSNQGIFVQSINQSCSWWHAKCQFKETNRMRGQRLWLSHHHHHSSFICSVIKSKYMCSKKFTWARHARLIWAVTTAYNYN